MLFTVIERNVYTRQLVKTTVWSRSDKFIYEQAKNIELGIT